MDSRNIFAENLQKYMVLILIIVLFSFIKTKLDKDNTKYKNTCEKNKQNV